MIKIEHMETEVADWGRKGIILRPRDFYLLLKLVRACQRTHISKVAVRSIIAKLERKP